MITHNRNIQLLVVALIASLFLLLTAGCETTEGFGRDVEKLGSNIEDTAEDNK